MKQGDVLGWIPEGGELAFAIVTPAEGAAFDFENSGKPNLGETLLRTSNHSVHHKHYIMAAHYVHATDFVIRHLYNSTGMKHVSSNITQTLSVAVDIPVGGEIFMTHSKVVNTIDSVEFSIAWHVGSNVSYFWDFGDGNRLITQTNVTYYTFKSPGNYHITLIVANSVNQKVLHSHISVFDMIQGLRFARQIEARAIGLPTEIEWETAEGTNLTFMVDFGDESPRYETTTVLKESRRGFILHNYAVVGNYTVTVFAFNLVGPNISITSHAVVEIPVTDVVFTIPAPHVTQTVYFAVGDTVTVNREVQNGTNVRCAFDFKDGSPPTISTKYNTSHVYTTNGTYKVEITCFNAVNSVKRLLNATLVVQNLENITGLILRASPSVFGTNSSITVEMTTGTVFVCTVSFGDGETFQIDYSHLGKVLYHQFSAVGSYNSSVRCQNRLGNEEYAKILEVDIPVKDVTVTSGKRFIRVHENIFIDVTVREGSRMKYSWDFNDGSTYVAYHTVVEDNELVSRSHAYSYSGEFPVNVTVSNSLSSIAVELPHTLVVEFPVANIFISTNSPVRLNPGRVTFHLSLSGNATPPTNAICVWNFSDGSIPTVIESLKISPMQPFEHAHKYKREGIFSTSVNISNNVSSLLLTVEVDVQKLIDLVLTAERFEDGARSKGFGELKNYFRSKEVVLFDVTSQLKDLKYIWHFGDGSTPGITTEPYTAHIFNHSGTYTVSVEVDNILAKMSTSKEIIIQKAVGAISVNSSYPTYLGDSTYFTIDVEEPGTDMCIVLDFKDSYKAHFGDERCNRGLPPNHVYYEFSANQTRANLSHRFGTMDTYAVAMNASNVVSSTVAVTLVNITSNPCDVPTVKIVGDGSESPPSKIKRSQKLLLKHQAEYRCPVAASLLFKWSVFQVTRDDPNDESKPFELPCSKDQGDCFLREIALPTTTSELEIADLVVSKGTFPFGHIKIVLKLGFIGTDRDLSDISATSSVVIEVERSELVAVIRGKLGIASSGLVLVVKNPESHRI